MGRVGVGGLPARPRRVGLPGEVERHRGDRHAEQQEQASTTTVRRRGRWLPGGADMVVEPAVLHRLLRGQASCPAVGVAQASAAGDQLLVHVVVVDEAFEECGCLRLPWRLRRWRLLGFRTFIARPTAGQHRHAAARVVVDHAAHEPEQRSLDQ
jgi:hypothetical protein